MISGRPTYRCTRHETYGIATPAPEVGRGHAPDKRHRHRPTYGIATPPTSGIATPAPEVRQGTAPDADTQDEACEGGHHCLLHPLPSSNVQPAFRQ